MPETQLDESASRLKENWRAALSMALYRSPEAVPNMKFRIITGAIVAVLQLGLLRYADLLRDRKPDLFANRYWIDDLVFVVTLSLAIGIVVIAIFGARFVSSVRAITQSDRTKALIARGLQILQDMRSTEDAKDEQGAHDAVEAAQHWQRIELQDAFARRPVLKQYFEKSAYRPAKFESKWEGVRQWVVGIDHDTGRLREAHTIVDARVLAR